MTVIYEPKGRALEYSLLACNLFTGCVHGCEYCYAPATLHLIPKHFHANVKPRHGILEKLRKEAPKYLGTNKRVLLCFTCDPYQPEEIEQGITRQALKILKEYDISFQILTKGGSRAERDFDLYGPKDAFATTLTFISKHASLGFEPRAAEPADRIKAIRLAKDLNITTWVSLEPVLDPCDSLKIIEMTAPMVDLFKIGKLNYRASETDWRRFGIDAIKLCEKRGVPYYIKNDLAKYLNGIEYMNCDTRRIEKNSLNKFGCVEPIVVNTRGRKNIIIGGKR